MVRITGGGSNWNSGNPRIRAKATIVVGRKGQMAAARGGKHPGNNFRGIPGDARQKIIAMKMSHITDARDMLAKMARTTDARDKLKKIKLMKEGKLDVTQTKKGAITITTTTQGKVLLTTKKKEMALNKQKSGNTKSAASTGGVAARSGGHLRVQASGKVAKVGNLTRRVGRGGAISISTKKPQTPSTLKRTPTTVQQQRPVVRKQQAVGSERRPGAGASRRNQRMDSKPIVRTIKGQMSESARLDDELINTHVDPVILKRTIKQSVRRGDSPPRYVPTRTLSPDYLSRRRERSRSPMAVDRGYDDYRPRRRAGYNDYDDPIRRADEDEIYRRRLLREQEDYSYSSPRTMADRLDAVSPLQGSKIIVSNLQSSVSQDDITELFGDIGPLKRTKMVSEGTAEVVFVNRNDASRAVEIYHNRQLDGKAMKCQVVSPALSSSNFQLTPSVGGAERHQLHPEMDSIHRALFNENKNNRSRGDTVRAPAKPLFTITMPQKGGR